MNTVKQGGYAAAEGTRRRRAAEIEEWLKDQPPPSNTELLRAIVLASLDGSSHNILYDRRHGTRGSSAKTISKALSIPLEDVQLVLRAFKKFMQSTADQLARKAAGWVQKGGK
jgi:hypothetical protein